MSNFEAAAWNLRHEVFGNNTMQGSVLLGEKKLYVFVYGKYYGTKPQLWNGYPVEWHVDCGMTVAQCA